jgi:hypothetical protein
MTRPITDPGHPEAGLSLVEVLASIALLALALIPLYRVASSAAELAIRVERQAVFSDYWRTAQAQLGSINPMIECSGERVFDEFEIRWSCEPVSVVARSRSVALSPMQILIQERGTGLEPLAGAFEIRLYRIDVEVRSQGRQQVRSVDRIGWRRLSAPA